MAKRTGKRAKKCPNAPGRRGYPDEETAIAAAIRSSAALGPLSTYRCPGCGLWKLTTVEADWRPIARADRRRVARQILDKNETTGG